jgi:hypothetical protein
MAVLLIVLWARSYSRYDVLAFSQAPLNRPQGSFYKWSVYQVPGMIGIDCHRKPLWDLKHRWTFTSKSIADEGIVAPDSFLGFRFYQSPLQWKFYVAHWFLVVVTSMAAIATLPRFSGRFNLRTLFIATTLVAVVLGLIVWAAGN